MRLFLTGASGFLGTHVVASALERGHSVRALVRPASSSTHLPLPRHHRLETVAGDLRSPSALPQLLEDVDSVVHLAACKAGDFYTQFEGTVVGTENLLAAMVQVGISRLVLISSFSVYEYLTRRSWSRLDEDSPLALRPLHRDDYCQTKLLQEQIASGFAKEQGWRYVVLRPGVLFGAHNLWTARIGIQVTDRWWVRTGALAPLPLTYVENCAEAITLAAEYDGPDRKLILNVVDDETPSQRKYMNVLKRSSAQRVRLIPLPWTLLRVLACLASLANGVFFSGTAKLPGLLIPERLHARCKPLRFSNHRLSSLLGWKPRYSFREALRRSLSLQQTPPQDPKPRVPQATTTESRHDSPRIPVR